MAFIEGWPHLRGGLYEGFHCIYESSTNTERELYFDFYCTYLISLNNGLGIYYSNSLLVPGIKLIKALRQAFISLQVL